MKYYIIPDVHGRLFYIDPVNKALQEDDSHIIFLGDYVDPYPHEHITPDEALERFKRILDLKKNNIDKITLLVGNHDLHYFDGSLRGCRMDYQNKDEISSLFKNNIDMFDYVKFLTVNGKNFILSHAGFNFNWFCGYAAQFGLCSESWDDFDQNKCVDMFNFDFLSKFDWKQMSLDPDWLFRYGDVSSSRGGYGNSPSFLWADLTDHIFTNVNVSGCEQIFAHTMQPVGQYVKSGKWYCLDCQNVFVLDSDAIVKTLDGCYLENNGEKIKNEYIAHFTKYFG